MSMSVDGVVAAPGWMPPAPGVDALEWQLATLRRAGTHVLGRVAYEAGQWPPGFAAATDGTPTVVLSRTLPDPARPGTTVARGDVGTEIDRLRRAPGGDIVVHGGASLAGALAGLGLIDEYRLLVHPLALGTGLRLFTGRVDLRPIESRPFGDGTIGHTYHPA